MAAYDEYMQTRLSRPQSPRTFKASGGRSGLIRNRKQGSDPQRFRGLASLVLTKRNAASGNEIADSQTRTTCSARAVDHCVLAYTKKSYFITWRSAQVKRKATEILTHSAPGHPA